jgi:hypothetical protein
MQLFRSTGPDLIENIVLFEALYDEVKNRRWNWRMHGHSVRLFVELSIETETRGLDVDSPVKGTHKILYCFKQLKTTMETWQEETTRKT